MVFSKAEESPFFCEIDSFLIIRRFLQKGSIFIKPQKSSYLLYFTIGPDVMV